MYKLPRSHMFARGAGIDQHLTLRNLHIDYKRNRGRAWIENEIPELSGAASFDQITCLLKLQNNIGNAGSSSMRCFELSCMPSLRVMLEEVSSRLFESINRGLLWCPSYTVLYSKHGDAWKNGSFACDESETEILNRIDSGRRV